MVKRTSLEVDEYLRVPWQGSRIAFVTAPLGFGKTEFVRRMLGGLDYVELEATDGALAERFSPQALAPYEAVVVNDVHAAQDAGIDIGPICREALERNADKRFVFVSRAPMPSWLLQSFARGEVFLVTRDDLWFTDTDIAHALRDNGLPSLPNVVEAVARASDRYAFAVSLAIRYLQMGVPADETLTNVVYEQTMLYFEDEFERRFDEQTKRVSLTMALFDEVDDDLIRAVLPAEDAKRLREALLQETNFIEPGDHGWHVTSYLREFCNWEVRHRRGEEAIEDVVDRAIDYYEGLGDFASALELCVRGGYRERALAILEEHARRSTDLGSYYDLERYYRELPDELVAASPAMMRSLSLVDSLCMDITSSERWYETLVRLAADGTVEEGVRQQAEAAVAFLDLALPHRRVTDLVGAVSRLARAEAVVGQGQVPRLEVTGCMPSVINGLRDLSAWVRDDVVTGAALDDLVPRVLGAGGVGIVDVALCESAFERGEDVLGRALRVSAALPRIRREGSLACEFAAMGVLARVRMEEGKPAEALRLADGLRRRLARMQGAEVERILANLEALRCRIWLRQGKAEHVAEWLGANAPDTMGRLYYLDRYRYLTACLAYLSRGQLDEALGLLSALDEYVESWDNTLDRIGFATIRAIVAWRRHDVSWQTQLASALELCWRYGYVRPITQYGAAVLPMLLEMQQAMGPEAGEDRDWAAWVGALVRASRTQASRYPDYLAETPGLADPLTETETQVLRLVCQGKSNAEIGRLLGIKLPTVKTHVSHIFAKLGVSRRAQATERARRLHLV